LIATYAAEEVEVIFYANNSMPGKPDDGRNAMAFATPES
jgi:hypothetical protein